MRKEGGREGGREAVLVVVMVMLGKRKGCEVR